TLPRPRGREIRKSPPGNPGGQYGRVGLARLERDFGFDLLFGLGRRRRRYGLNAQLELDLVPQDEAAGLERLVPGQVVVLAVQPGLRVEAHPAIAPGVLALAIEAGVEHDFLGDAVDRHIPDQLEVRRILALDARAGKGDGWIIRDVEMAIGAAKVVVAHFHARINTRRIEDNAHLRGAEVLVIDLDP